MARTSSTSATASSGLDRLAARANDFRVSPWETPVDLHGRHEAPISLSTGAPSETLVPTDRLRDAAARAWSESGQWGYSGLSGYLPLREWLAEWSAGRGITTTPDDIVLLSGSQQGIDLVARAYLESGDYVVIEGPTYIGALQVFDSYEARYLTIPMDDEGMSAEALVSTLEEHRRRRRRLPKLLYTIPTFQNPSGRLMSDRRRDQILAIAREYGIVVVEDDPYGELYFGQKPPKSLRARDADVISLGTFSKTLAPALRMGWAVLPPAIVGIIANAREVADVCGDRITQRIVAYTVHDFMDDHVAWLREQYAQRAERLTIALERSLPETVRYRRPEGGYFAWVDLPDGMDAASMMPLAADYGVLYLPGGWCFPDRRPDPGIRLSFANVPEEWLDEGADRLGSTIRSALAMEPTDE